MHTIELWPIFFAILTALVLAVSAFLAYQNMGSEDDEQRGYRGWIAARQSEEASLSRNEKKLADTKETLESTNTKLAEVKAAAEALQVDVDGLLATNQKLKADESAKETAAADKKLKVDTAKEDFQDIGEIEEVIAEFKETSAKLVTLQAEIEEKEAQRAQLENRKSQSQASIDAVREQIKYRVTQESVPDLRTKVVGVYPTLGFVTLAAGDNLGVVKDSSLDVVRDNQVVGKLLVTTVEARTAAGDIVPDSFESGDGPRVGDTVVPTPKTAPEAPAGPAVNPEPVG